MNKWIIDFDEKLTNRMGRMIENKKYKLFCKVWNTYEDRMNGNMRMSYITDQSLTMAILNPKFKLEKGGAAEIWVEGPTRELLYITSPTCKGLYKPTLNRFKILESSENFILEDKKRA